MVAALRGARCTETSGPGAPEGLEALEVARALIRRTLCSLGLSGVYVSAQQCPPLGTPGAGLSRCPVPTLSPCRQQSRGAPRQASQQDSGPAAYRAGLLLAPLGTPGLCRCDAALWDWPMSSGTPCPAWSATPGVGQGASPTSCLPATAPWTLEDEPGSALFQA